MPVLYLEKSHSKTLYHRCNLYLSCRWWRGFSYQKLYRYGNKTSVPYLSASLSNDDIIWAHWQKILIRLKDPLILKFASSNYLGKSLSESAIDYTSLSLFNKMLCDIRNSYAGNLQYDIISCIGDYLLNKYMKGFPVSTISTESLKEAYHETDSALYDLSRKIYKKMVSALPMPNC